MPSKFPCCSDCGHKLTETLSLVRFPNKYRVRFYFCKKCETEQVKIRVKLETKSDSTYQSMIYNYIFSHIKK